MEVRRALFHVPCNTTVSVSLAIKGVAKYANMQLCLKVSCVFAWALLQERVKGWKETGVERQ